MNGTSHPITTPPEGVGLLPALGLFSTSGFNTFEDKAQPALEAALAASPRECHRRDSGKAFYYAYRSKNGEGRDTVRALFVVRCGAVETREDLLDNSTRAPVIKLVNLILFEAGKANPEMIALAVDTASAQGWRRPLLAWLKVQALRAQGAGAADEALRLQRRIELVQDDR